MSITMLNASNQQRIQTIAGKVVGIESLFEKDMIDLFQKKRSGHAAGHVYRGALSEKFNALTKVDDYYPAREDIEIILNYAGYYRELSQALKSDGPLTVVELGPGKASEKTKLFLDIVRPDNYVAVDMSEDSLLSTAFMVREEFPDINFYLRAADFYKDSIEEREVWRSKMEEGVSSSQRVLEKQDEVLPTEGRRLFIQFGQTLGNREAFFDGPPPEESLVRDLSHIRHKMMRPRDVAVYSVDMNPDMSDVLKAYKSELNEELVMGVLHRMKNELPTKNFYVNNFSFSKATNSSNNFFGQGFVVEKPNEFMIGHEEITLSEKGAFFSLANSLRFSQIFLNKVYGLSAQQLIRDLPHPSNRMHHQVLEAVYR